MGYRAMQECKSFGLADGFLGICSRCMTLGEGRREKRERRKEKGERRKENDKNAAN